MARKKEYDKEEVLDQATILFWEKGFKATSIGDIVKATGLNKYSMYEEFKNKEGLFKAALSNYTDKLQKENIAHLTKEPLGLKNIENFLLNRVNYATCDDFKGCLVVNSLVEKESLNSDIFSNIQLLLNGYEEQVIECLESAKKNKEIAESKDSKTIAKLVVNFSSGVLVNGKLGQKREEYIAMLDFFMDSIKN